MATEGRPLEVEIERNGGKQQIREAYREVWGEEKSEGGMEGDGREGRKGRKKRELEMPRERRKGGEGKREGMRGMGKRSCEKAKDNEEEKE